MKKKELAIHNVDDFKGKIYTIRGVQVMLDSDLAEIYGYEVKTLNQQVKRNINRFPPDFMFQLIREELDLVKSQCGDLNLKSQFVTSSWGGIRKLPNAFTEYGITMLASVLSHAFPTETFCRIYKKFSVGLFRRVEAECFSVRGKNVYLYSEKRCSFPVMLRKYQWKNINSHGFRFTRNWRRNY